MGVHLLPRDEGVGTGRADAACVGSSRQPDAAGVLIRRQRSGRRQSAGLGCRLSASWSADRAAGPGQTRVKFTRSLAASAHASWPDGELVPGVRVRSATPADIPAVLRFWKLSAEDARRPADRSSALARLIQRDPDALVLAVAGEEIVGSVILGWDGWRCHIYRLAVRPDHRRQGIGHALLRLAETRLGDAPVSRLDAMVLDTNLPAHELWSRAGYRRQREWSRWIKPLSRG
jgi:ribosomal protein S18 acetylase RimI-like enzyme